MRKSENGLARGLMWRRQIARISERRAARHKERKSVSAPSTPPPADAFVAQNGIGSPGVISENKYFPATLINWQGYQASPIA